MLTHRLMIAKRLYSILKRNVINRFVRIFVLRFFFPLECDALWSDDDSTLYSTNFVFENTEILLWYCLRFSCFAFASIKPPSHIPTIYFRIFVVRLILLILFLCVDAWENTWLNTNLDRYSGSGQNFQLNETNAQPNHRRCLFLWMAPIGTFQPHWG